MFTYSCFGENPTQLEKLLITETFRAFGRYRQTELSRTMAARLAKLRAERCVRIPPGSNDADALRALLVSPSQPVWSDAEHTDLAHRAVRLSNFAEQLLPVLEGTHKIVPLAPQTAARCPEPASPSSQAAEATEGVQKLCYDRVLLHPMEGDIVSVQFERHGTSWTATSPQLPGLLLAHREFTTVCAQLKPVIERLHQLMTRPTTIETHTPGDDRSVLRDFLTEGDARGAEEYRRTGIPQPKIGVPSGKAPAFRKPEAPHCCEINCKKDADWYLQWRPYGYEDNTYACNQHVADMLAFADATEFHIEPIEQLYRDFLTTQEGPFQQGDGMAIKVGPSERFLWIDHEGNAHPTDRARLEANKLIEAKRRAQKAGAE